MFYRIIRIKSDDSSDTILSQFNEKRTQNMISLQNIEKAAGLLTGKINKTPLVYSPTISRMVNAEVFLKLENLQKTGSFKIRGATHKLIVRKNDIGINGVVTASAGNHAQGVALSAKLLDIPATIIMPEWTSISKQEATVKYGGNVIIYGTSVEESLKKAMALTRKQMTFIHPFDDPDIIHGQGTLALEIFEDLPDTDLIIVPVGGGGLISGIATAARSICPAAKIIGVQAANCPSAHQSLKAGRITKVKARLSIADGINVKQTGLITFGLMKQYVDEIRLVDEGEIARAILLLLERKKVLAEGAGAVALAAVLNPQFKIPSKSKVVLIISGGNVDSSLLDRIINQGLIQSGRILRLSIYLEDRPGALSKLLERIAALQANVLNIHHERGSKTLPLYTTRVEMELETRGQNHLEKILAQLNVDGYQLESKS